MLSTIVYLHSKLKTMNQKETITQSFVPCENIPFIVLSHYATINLYSFYICDQSEIERDCFHNVIAIFRIKLK